MDLYDRLNATLEPLAGELFVDAFAQTCKSVAARRESVPQAEPEPTPVTSADVASSSPELSDSQRLRLEVEEFMKRDRQDDTLDDEIGQFMSEQSGFDPSEIE